MADHYRREKVHVVISVVVWFGLALVAGYAGLLRDAPAPAIPFVILVLSALVLFVFLRLPPFRDWAVQVELRWLVLLHVTRFIGFYFLYLAGRGEIPRAWADPAGIGDVAIACVALLLFIEGAKRRTLLLMWNALGLIDILLVVIGAMRLGLKNAHSTAFLRELPLSLLPTFLVPLVIATHFLIFVRTRRRRALGG